jgi:hypothetical protein
MNLIVTGGVSSPKLRHYYTRIRGEVSDAIFYQCNYNALIARFFFFFVFNYFSYLSVAVTKCLVNIPLCYYPSLFINFSSFLVFLFAVYFPYFVSMSGAVTLFFSQF